MRPHCLTAVACFAITFGVAASQVALQPHIKDILSGADYTHERYFPDFKYEDFETPHEAQPAKNLNRRGSGPHDVIDVTQSTPNPHMANISWDYPYNVQWLLNIFETGFGLPRSYNDVLPNGNVYWGTQTYLRVGAFDEYGHPTELSSMIAIQERTLTRFGLNLYDAATWQIALSLWNLHDVGYIYEENILYPSTTGPGTNNNIIGGLVNIRADNNGFHYGPSRAGGADLPNVTYAGNVTHFPAVNGKPGAPTKTGPGAFYYRMIGPYYVMNDPMNGNYGQSWKFPWPNYDSTTSWNTFGEIHFNDMKPITGENVWSAMLGPIQSLGLRTNNNLTNTTCGNEFSVEKLACDWKTFETTPPSIQQGMSILPALRALSDETGTLFHCPWGSKLFPPDPDEGANISNENNFSGFASIDTFYQALMNYTGGSPTDPHLRYALITAQRLRDGLIKWFDASTILSAKGQLPNNEQVVPQGGHLNNSGYFPVPIDTTGGLAVDCQTWGMTVMTRPRIDHNWGHGTSYNIWQTAKKYAGYYKGSVLAGVGYTDLANANGSVPVNTIWSAEWTFGAINMCQIIGQSYIDNGDTQMGQSMLNDAQSMYNEVTMMWPQGLRFPDGSYVYANKRFFIPWGWFSNPISATCSTAWSVMQARNFDPFHYGGGYKPELLTPVHLPPGFQ